MTSLIKVPFASSGDKTAVPETDAGGGVNMTQGYGQAYSLDPATDPSAKRIERDKMNWLFNLITKAINEIQTSGIAPFITSNDNGGSAFSYGKGALVSLGGVVYQSLVASNVTTPPGASWEALPEKIQPLDATLTAIASLVGAANKLPYFNGDDTAALTDLTQVGRDIIGKNAIADILQYLGLQFFQSAPSSFDGSFTSILSPDEELRFVLANSREWGVQDSTGGVIPLSIGRGGIGATTAEEGLKKLGLADSDGRVGRLINVRVITTSGTYTPSTGTKSVVVEVQGGGGAGGAAGTPSSGTIAMGGGGAAGAYARSRLTVGFSGVQITIGAGGKGKKPDYTGMNGGNSSFGTITAAGGTGGAAVGAAPPFIITAVGGATASGGSVVSVTGASSLTGIALSDSYLSSGPGGSSPLGSGGGPRSTAIAGDNASGFGSGGSGALNLHGASSDLLGGNGSDGVVIVWEYA